MSALGDAAVAAAEAGLRVFPLKARGKEPRVKGGSGFKSASSDPAFVAGLWSRWMDANIGLDLPPLTVVVDIDADDGPELVRELGLPPAAAVVRTARGHQGYYRLPEGRELRQGPLPGVGDLKSSGSGYTLLPPSIHPDGPTYAFVRGGIGGIVAATRLSDENVDALERLRGVRSNRATPAVGERIPRGERRTALLSLAGSMRRRGLTGDEIGVALLAVNGNRCDPPLGEDEVLSVARDVGSRYEPAAVAVATPPVATTGSRDAEPPVVRFVALTEYVATPKGSGEALIGDADAFEVILPVGGLLLMYGAQGVSKTTKVIDCVAHLASGTDWHGKKIARPVRVAVIENEGPAEQFRQKLARKIETWEGAAWAENVLVLDQPHGGFDFRREEHREAVRDLRRGGVELIVADPTKWLGFEGGGTPDEVRAFVALLRLCGLHSGDRDAALAFSLLHHENKAGEVSGAWGADPDTLVHVELDGRERTKLTWEKCRWALAQHGRVEIYRWLPDTAGFEPIDLPDTPQTSDDDLDEMVRVWLVDHPDKHSTTAVRDAMPVRAERTDQALERLKNRGDCLDLDRKSSPHDGRPRTARYWIATVHAASEVVPTLGTTTDDHESRSPEAVRSRPVVPPIGGTTPGRDDSTDNPDDDHTRHAKPSPVCGSEPNLTTAARDPDLLAGIWPDTSELTSEEAIGADVGALVNAGLWAEESP